MDRWEGNKRLGNDFFVEFLGLRLSLLQFLYAVSGLTSRNISTRFQAVVLSPLQYKVLVSS